MKAKILIFLLFVTIIGIFNPSTADPADFALVFRYDATTYYLMYDNMTTYYTGSNLSQYSFAVDRPNNYFFVNENGILLRKSLIDGATQATSAIYNSTNQRPIVVDADGNLWTYLYSDYKIYKYLPDLSAATEYVMSRGQPGDLLSSNDTFYDVVMSYDGQYMAITSNNKQYCAVYNIDSLTVIDGSRWNKYVGAGKAAWSVFDDSNNVYLSESGANNIIRRLSFTNAGASEWAVSNTSPYNVYSFLDSMIYTGMNDNGLNKFYKHNKITGIEYAHTYSINSRAFSLAFYDDSTLYTGSGRLSGIRTGIRKWNTAADDWLPTDTSIAEDSLIIATDKYYIFFGDPTGFIHNKIAGVGGGGVAATNKSFKTIKKWW